MGKVLTQFTMSLDGFIAGPNDEVDRLFRWCCGEEAPVLLGAGIRLFDHLGPDSIDLKSVGAIERAGVTHLRFRVLG